MKNKLTDLNDHLFAQLERLSEEGLKPEQIAQEVERTEAIVAVAEQIVRNADLQLKAVSILANHERMRPHRSPEDSMTHPNPEGGEAKGRHTPGPWTVEQGDGGLDADARFPSEAKVLVYADGDCEIHPVADCSCNHTCRDENTCEANARLIASAPDLLALARVSAAQFRFYEQQHRAKGTPEADAKAEVNRELAERIEAAISAATGARP